MPLTREVLEAELEGLLRQEKQAFANFNAVLGARQQVEKLLAMFDEPEPKPAHENDN